MSSDSPIVERSTEAKAAYLEGYKAGHEDAQKMMRRALSQMEEHGHTIYDSIKATLASSREQA